MSRHYDDIEIPDFIREGNEYVIGTYTFTENEILEFAREFDPQPFHVDPKAAEESLLGGLCASGWHTTSIWMRLQRRATAEHTARLKACKKSWPEFGPSPGMKDIKWPRPVFANDEITYSNKILSIRRSNSKPDWWIMGNFSRGMNQHDETVLEFSSSVFLKIHAYQ